HRQAQAFREEDREDRPPLVEQPLEEVQGGALEEQEEGVMPDLGGQGHHPRREGEQGQADEAANRPATRSSHLKANPRAAATAPTRRTAVSEWPRCCQQCRPRMYSGGWWPQRLSW